LARSASVAKKERSASQGSAGRSDKIGGQLNDLSPVFEQRRHNIGLLQKCNN
jgi:hypothetical protein